MPIIIFFLAYKTLGLMAATASMIIFSLLQVIYTRVKTGSYEKMQLISGAVLIVFGGATLLFRNEMFIKWKLTVTYWIVALAFISSELFTQKTLVQRVAEQHFFMSDKNWSKLNFIWFVFALLMGILNLYVAYNFDTQFWVNFKLFGTLVISIIFISIQALFIFRMNNASTENPEQLPKINQ